MWSLIENDDGTKTIKRDDRVIGIYSQIKQRWVGIKPDGRICWGSDECDVFEQLIEAQQ